MTMTEPEIIARLTEWQCRHEKFSAAYRAFADLTGAAPESAFMGQILALWDAYTKAVSEIVGDLSRESWLDWYAYECDMGKSPKDVEFQDGRQTVIATLADLAKLIADEVTT